MSKKKRSLWIQTRKTRGEDFYRRIPKIGAIFFEKLMDSEMIDKQIEEIKTEILSKIRKGKILEVGPGPGTLLRRINEDNPNLELYGLDISKAMIKLAKENLDGADIHILHGNIKETEFDSSFFDLVTCTGSFYLWDNPIEGLNEIHRILKKDGLAILFETYSNYDKKRFEESLKQNMKKVKIHKRPVVKRLLFKQLSITYTINEVEEILKKTAFSKNASIERIALSDLPIWMKISLIKK
jgi:ubiquinone/menaquinone biosynthesis C-methylase UbiE